MLDFLTDLTRTGRVTATLLEDASDPSELEQAVRAIDANTRLDLAFDPPALVMPVALWSLRFIENACRFLVYRELDEAVIREAFKPVCPRGPEAGRIYSADLFLRYLPDITRMARGMGSDDPLVEQLLKLAADWPLSSVGMPGQICDSLAVDAIVSQPSLRQMYVDRIIESADLSRLISPAVIDAVTESLGDHAMTLAPAIAGALKKLQSAEQIPA